ncbi:hypothetical protein BKA65DRAFT_192747 [Rhexocercosporidium sp. MPI-PUGE-AT-0058]|nr:hypothetical protein BKA65DRAFT_192747 [Rhexocercosporidium sp. MPI-PUGE-AT-0058]
MLYQPNATMLALISNHVRRVLLAWPSTFWVPCPHNCSLPPLSNVNQRCWKTRARKPYDSLLYAPGAIIARVSYPAASRRTAPFLPHQACPISHSFSSRLVPAVESAFWSACRSKIKPKTRPDRKCDLSASPTIILSHAIQTHVLDPTLLPLLLRTTRAALFPNNTLAPPRSIPSPPEQLLIRRRCAETILSLVPARIQDVYFGPGIDRRVREVEDVLNVFDDSYCNKHLLYGVVELIIVRLLPEMAEKGVEELLEERLS